MWYPLLKCVHHVHAIISDDAAIAEQSDTHTMLCMIDAYCATRDAELMLAHRLRHWLAALHHRWFHCTLVSLGLYIYVGTSIGLVWQGSASDERPPPGRRYRRHLATWSTRSTLSLATQSVEQADVSVLPPQSMPRGRSRSVQHSITIHLSQCMAL